MTLTTKALRVRACFSTPSLSLSGAGELTVFLVEAVVSAQVPANLHRHSSVSKKYT